VFSLLFPLKFKNIENLWRCEERITKVKSQFYLHHKSKIRKNPGIKAGVYTIHGNSHQAKALLFDHQLKTSKYFLQRLFVVVPLQKRFISD
jgi:hypothetical protein